MNWLITGGCGFLGTSLITSLLSENNKHKIRVLDNLKTGTLVDLANVCDFKKINASNASFIHDYVEFVEGDILDETLAILVAKDSDVIVHFAANTGVGPSVDDPRKDMLVNIVGTFNYLEAARLNHIKRFVFASSGAPAGEIEPPIHEEIAPHPVSPYGASKLAGEGYNSAYNRTFGIETVVLRFGNVYGPGSLHKNSVVAKFIRQALLGEMLEIYGDGGQTRDFIYIDDLIDAVLSAAIKPDIGGQLFQIASSRETTVSEIADTIVKVLLAKGVGDVSIVNGDTRKGDVLRNFSDTSKARKMLGWKAQTGLHEGLEATVDYFMNLKKEEL